jgi:DNA-binding response OmpR family regulator
MKILGIDDSFAVNELLDTVLNGSGHDFRYVDNGKEGLELIRSQKFDLVFLDLAMPEFSGVDVLHALKKDNIIDKQKIILFTASSATEREMVELVKIGAHSYMRKPVDIDDMLEKIDSMI